MRKVLKYLISNCRQAMIHRNELIFEFVDFHYVYSFNLNPNLNNNFDDYYTSNTIKKIDELELFLIEVDKCTSVEIKNYECLREPNMTKGRSISIEMYSWLKRLYKFSSNIVDKYHTDIDYEDRMCDSDGNYYYSIQINENYWWDIDFIKASLLDRITASDPPNFYTRFFRKNEPLKDNLSLNILTTNTKVRRLGYFKILAHFLDEKKKIPAKSINRLFEDYCEKYKDSLENNIHSKGLIKQTKTGVSAKPYIDLSINLDYLNWINNIFYTGKSFKVYQTIQGDFSENDNIFDLSDFDRLFFLESILRNDYFYFSCLLELVFIEEKVTYSRLIQKYQNHLISRLKKYQRSNIHRHRKERNIFKSIIKRISKWEKPHVYLEHIIMPRINWMLDLKLLIIKNNEYELTNVGLKIFEHLCIWNDINRQEVVSPNTFLNQFMIHIFDDSNKEIETINPSESDIIKKLSKHIDDSFLYFKTLAPNRVTASQAANYTKYKLYFDNKIKVRYQYILGKLSEEKQQKFIFKYQKQYQDGYIQKKIKNDRY